jgi:hypothetical protein
MSGKMVSPAKRYKIPTYFFSQNSENTLQGTNTENPKQIFPEKELRGHNPNYHIHVSVSDLYIPMIDLSILLQKICGPILEIYKSRTDT